MLTLVVVLCLILFDLQRARRFLRTSRRRPPVRYGLHCPHDGYQNPCQNCGARPIPEPHEGDYDV